MTIWQGSLVITGSFPVRAVLARLPGGLRSIFEHDVRIRCPGCMMDQPRQGDLSGGPLDPNFTGCGRAFTDGEGRYRFRTIRPGPYPWRNHHNAWRPAHIHFSLMGRAFAQRLVTQMYFPGDPLFEFDPIFQSVRDPKARERLIAGFELDLTQPEWALGYRFDIVLRSTPFE